MKRAAAFSWVEALVFIAVIWAIAVIAIPNWSALIEGRWVAKSQESAMSLASLSLAARNCGHPGWSNRPDAVRDLLAGVSVTNPADSRIVIRFQGKNLSPKELGAALSYLTFDGQKLVYVPAGDQPAD